MKYKGYRGDAENAVTLVFHFRIFTPSHFHIKKLLPLK